MRKMIFTRSIYNIDFCEEKTTKAGHVVSQEGLQKDVWGHVVVVGHHY